MTDGNQAEAVRKTLGQKICIGAALLCLLGGGALLTLSCCPVRRRVPPVPTLPPAPETIALPETVTVLVASAGHLVAEARAGTWVLSRGRTPQIVESRPGPWRIAAKEGMLTLGGRALGTNVVELLPAGELFTLGARTYRGRLRVEAEGDEEVKAFNLVAPEQYLRSVVGSEMYSAWPMDALMAQAVAARTYMIYTQQTKGYLGPLDMAYKGVSAESRSCDLAVRLTEGIVLTYRGRLFSAYFHSTCGGHTVSASKVFGDEPIGPLSGVPGGWCEQSPAYRWTVALPAERIGKALASAKIGTVRSLRPLGTSPDGYADEVLVNGEVRMDANDFRLAVGGSVLKSTWFTVERRGGEFLFRGRGYGHGVGLCQWGACGMAREGYGWREILRHYYPGAALLRLF